MTDLSCIEELTADKLSKVLDVSQKLWDWSELSHAEFQSAELLCSTLEEEGFTVERGVCGEKTAFVATYGAGKPVIGLLGEYDALPNLSQKADCTEKEARENTDNGHGCGHNLIGAGSLLAALVMKEYLEKNKLAGTIKYYGCAGEENIGVKPFMARDGLFKDTDCVFAWHPETYTRMVNLNHYAAKIFNVEFFGKTSHAGSAPELGRSALDACELMNVGCNYLREHVVQDARIHYSYLDAGGIACNTVPDHAKLSYGVRALKIKNVDEIVERVKNVARGAAMMTDTKVKITPVFGYSDFFQNSVIAQIGIEAMKEVGAPQWSDEDLERARELRSHYDEQMVQSLEQEVKARYPKEEWEEKMSCPLDTLVTGYEPGSQPWVNAGSTDVGDVAYVVPTSYMFIACTTMSAPGHSWFWTSMAGGEMGRKCVLTAGKILALSCVKALKNPERLKAAREEWLATTGGEYICPM